MTVQWPCFISECLHVYRKYIIIFAPQAYRLPTLKIMYHDWRGQYWKLKQLLLYIYIDQHEIFQQMWMLWGHCISHSQLTLGISEHASSCHEWWPRCQTKKTNGHFVCLHYSLKLCKFHLQNCWAYLSRICDQIPILVHTVCVTLGKLFNFSKARGHHL